MKRLHKANLPTTDSIAETAVAAGFTLTQRNHADTEIALAYYNYRHYNPVDGRWLGRDPIGEVDQCNLYAYVSNALYKLDHLGLMECNAKNVGKYKDVSVQIIMHTGMDEYVVADSDDANLLKHFKDALKNKAEDVIEQKLRGTIPQLDVIAGILDEAKKWIDDHIGSKKFKYLSELLGSSGRIIREFEVKVSAELCCCKRGEQGKRGTYYFSKKKGSAETDDYHFHIVDFDKYDLMHIRNLPDDLVYTSIKAIKDLKSQQCK